MVGWDRLRPPSEHTGHTHATPTGPGGSSDPAGAGPYTAGVEPVVSVEMDVTAMASDGRAVGRERSGRVAFVAGALPGERVRVRLVGAHARYADAVVEEVLEASPDRVAAPCRHVAEGCGGCQWQHLEPGGQIHVKEQIVVDTLARIGRLGDPPLQPTVALEPWRYRTALRVGVVDGRAGLRRTRSNELVPVPGCLIVHPLIGELLEGPRFPGAESVILRCGVRTGERLAAASPTGVGADVPPDVRPDRLHEVAAGRRWRISAGSFFQSRPDGADALAVMVGEAAAAMGRASTAVDLYSGVGLFAGVLARDGWAVTAVEGSATAAGDARCNLADDGVKVIRSDVLRWRPSPADLVVADPSRAGLGRAGVGVVAATGARRVILVSCDAASLGRDAGLLTAAGYRLSSVTPVDLFPQTFRVEVVSVFDRL